MKKNPILRRAISTIAITALTVFAPISAVSAHTELVSTSPEADSEVNVAGEIISLTFGEPPLADGAAIVIVNESGETLMTPTPTLEGATLSIPWPMDLSPGKVTVQWRARADDGHVLNGEYTFNYTAAAESGPAPSAPTVEPSVEPSVDPSAAPSETVAEPTITALAIPEVIAMPLETTDETSSSNLFVGIAIAAMAGLVLVGLYMRRSK